MSSESNRTALFVASCVSLLTTSMVFAIRGDIGTDLGIAFNLTKEQLGQIYSPAFWGFTISIFICGFLNDVIGMKPLHALSSIGFILGVGLVLVAPHAAEGAAPLASIFDTTGTTMLFSGFLLMGLSQGVVEGVINPLIATLYSDKKTHKLNVLHAWWPGGMIIGGVLALILTSFDAIWQVKLGAIMVPAIVFLGIVLTQKYPKTERVSSGISTPDMTKQLLRPLFLVLCVAMCATAASELGPGQWFPTIMGALTPLDPEHGIGFLIYTAGLMFVLRLFAGPISRKITPPTLLTICSVLTMTGLFWLGSLTAPVEATDTVAAVAGSPAWVAFAAATIFGLGIAFYWPTMLAMTAEQFPKGGSLAMCVMGGAGMLSIALILPFMGRLFDDLGPAAALKTVSYLPAVLIFVFAHLALHYRYNKGGYSVRSVDDESGED